MIDLSVLLEPGAIIRFDYYEFNNTGTTKYAKTAVVLEAPSFAEMAGFKGFVCCFFTSQDRLRSFEMTGTYADGLIQPGSKISLDSLEEVGHTCPQQRRVVRGLGVGVSGEGTSFYSTRNVVTHTRAYTMPTRTSGRVCPSRRRSSRT